MKSIGFKLVIMYIVLVFIVMISAGTFMVLSIRYNEIRSAQDELEDLSKHVYENVIEGNAEADFDELLNPSIYSGILPAGTGVYIIRSSDYSIIQSIIRSSDGTTIPSKNTSISSPVVIAALTGTEELSSDRKDFNEEGRKVSLIELATPVTGGDGAEYVIYCSKEATSINESLEQLTKTIAAALVMALTFALIVGALFARTLTEPISVLTKKTKDFAAGKLEGSIPVQSRDEIGQLTESFNNMARQLNSTLSDMEGEKNKLEIVLYNMTDGILVYDTDGKNIHVNRACAALLDMDVEEISDIPFLRMIRILNIENLGDGNDFDEFSELDKFADKTISIGEKYINLVFSLYKNKEGEFEGVIIVLQDITKHMRLDNMRREFVANVSHEIRTPITTIKSYTETIMDSVIEDKQKTLEFLGIIDKEADRMTNIVRDLLELSRLDNQKGELNLAEDDLVALVRQNVKMHKQNVKAHKMNKTIVFKSNVANILLNIDSARINQVLNNVISNSLRYTYEKALIEVEIESGSDFHKVYVRDNGMGIPADDLNRIFERFYRVDKARSRALGGTGLGLSIAKEIMEAHGGSISATSVLGKGTTMVMIFPNEIAVQQEQLNSQY